MVDEYEHVVKGKLQLKGVKLKTHKGKKKKKRKREKESEAKVEEEILRNDGLTDAQKKHKKYKERSEQKLLKEIAKKSYREHVEEYNTQLSNMTEHHDIPKISAAGNG